MSQSQNRSSVMHGLLYLLLSAGFLVLGFWYPIWLSKQYEENDFRAGQALLLSLVAGLI